MDKAASQEEVNHLFERANGIITAQLTVRDPDSFYDLVEVDSAAKRAAWEAGADCLLMIADETPEEKKFYSLS